MEDGWTGIEMSTEGIEARVILTHEGKAWIFQHDLGHVDSQSVPRSHVPRPSADLGLFDLNR